MRKCTSGIAFLGLLLLASAAQSDEFKVELSDVPSVGIAAVKSMFPTATIEGAAKETEGDKTVFEVTLKRQDRTIDVTLGLDGKIQVVERQITEKELPVIVKEALRSKYPKATFKIIEQVDSMKKDKLSLDFYEVLLSVADKQSIEIQVAPDGEIKAEEKKKPGDND